jgi:hypothetical protein
MSPATPTYKRIHFVASPIPEAQEALKRLTSSYGEVPPESADVIVALGGDGLMLQTLHRFMTTGKPIYGMHRGTVGFLMNEYYADELPERPTKRRGCAFSSMARSGCANWWPTDCCCRRPPDRLRITSLRKDRSFRSMHR